MRIITPSQIDPEHPRRVVVVGSGYAGMTFASRLARRMRSADGIELWHGGILFGVCRST